MEVPLRDVPLFITEEKSWKWWRKSCVAASLIKKGGLHPWTTNVHACRHQLGVSNDHYKLISTDCWRYLWIIKVYKICFRHEWKVDTTSLLWKVSNTWPSSDKGSRMVGSCQLWVSDLTLISFHGVMQASKLSTLRLVPSQDKELTNSSSSPLITGFINPLDA